MDLNSEREARERLLSIAQEVRAELGIRPEWGWREIAPLAEQAFGLRVKAGHLSEDEGWHVPDSPYGPATVGINTWDRGYERMTFTLCHELMHHVLRQDRNGSLLSFLHELAPGSSLDAVLERYCDMGAAEILLPAQSVRDVIRERGFSITLVEELDQRFAASRPAIAIQLAQCASHKCFVVVCDLGVPSTGNPAQREMSQLRVPAHPCLYTSWSSSSPSCSYRIGRNVPIPHDHLIAQAYEEQALVRGRGRIPFRSGRNWIADSEAFFYKGRVYAAFNVTDPGSPLQMALF